MLGLTAAAASAASVTVTAPQAGAVLYTGGAFTAPVSYAATLDKGGCKSGLWYIEASGDGVHWASVTGGIISQSSLSASGNVTAGIHYVRGRLGCIDPSSESTTGGERSYTVVSGNQPMPVPVIPKLPVVPKPAPAACQQRNAWLYGPKAREYAAGLAQQAQDAAGDGHDLADNVDVIGVTAKLLARTQLNSVAKKIFDVAAGKVQAAVREEYDLTKREAAYGAGRDKAISRYRAESSEVTPLRKEAARLRGQAGRLRKNRPDIVRERKRLLGLAAEADGKATRAVARAQLYHDAWLVLEHDKLAVAQKLEAARKAAAEWLTKLVAPLNRLGDTGAGQFLGGTLGGFNLIGDTATVWELYWSFVSYLANQWAKPPPGCGELWLPYVPRSTKPYDAWASAAPSATRGLAPALGGVSPRLFGAARASAIGREARRVSATVAALRELSPETARGRLSRVTPAARRNATAILKQAGALLREFRGLARNLKLPPVEIAAAVLAAHRSGAGARARLRYWQTPPSLLAAAGSPPLPLGAKLDPAAVLRGDRLARAIAQMLSAPRG